jgi:hypothetical protein
MTQMPGGSSPRETQVVRAAVNQGFDFNEEKHDERVHAHQTHHTHMHPSHSPMALLSSSTSTSSSSSAPPTPSLSEGYSNDASESHSDDSDSPQTPTGLFHNLYGGGSFSTQAPANEKIDEASGNQ